MHYHVERNINDDEIYTAETLNDALSYAKSELATLIQMEDENFTIHFEAEEWRLACMAESKKREIEFTVIVIDSYLTQFIGYAAPRYKGMTTDEKVKALKSRGDEAIRLVHESSPVAIWSCNEEIREASPAEEAIFGQSLICSAWE